MSQINLTAGSIRLHNYSRSDVFVLSVENNPNSIREINIQGIDDLYSLQYIVNRAIQKLEL